jgi:capsular polysaccharide biosynthesis protein
MTHNIDDQPLAAIQTDVALAQSRSVAERAMHQLGLSQSGQSISSFLAAYVVTWTTDRVLVITVGAPSSSKAIARANAVATAFLQFRAQQLRGQEQLVLAALSQRVTQARRQVDLLAGQVAKTSAQPASAPQRARLKRLEVQLRRANGTLYGLQLTASDFQVTTASEIEGSGVLDPAAPITHTHKLLSPGLTTPLLYAGTGLIPGLVLGMAFVVVRELVSDRLRRRDDVAHALGAPVRLSVGGVRVGGLLGRRGLAAADSGEVRRIVAHLRGVVPRGSKHAAALAVVAVDRADVAALALVSLAVSVAAEGRRVVLADLCGSAPAARLLGAPGRGVSAVNVQGTHLIVAVPGRDDGVPAGPLRRGSLSTRQQSSRELPGGSDDGVTAGSLPGWQRPSRELVAACESADLLLTLARLDPSTGGDHLATWASDAVVMVTAGQSSWTKIHAVGEMIRLARIRLASAVLVGADKTDESLGVTHAPPAPVGPDLRVTGR